jgi:serine/threonine protein kinase/Tfp pilus assembly protein PilF
MSLADESNLLFAVIALQAGILDNDQFAQACTLWATRKETGLPDLLLAHGWLTEQDRAHVDYLVQRKLIKHAGDARASLAAVATDRVKNVLTRVGDPAAGEGLEDFSLSVETVRTATVAYEPHGRERYTLCRLHATGGIGQVWLARDDDLGREVALKELRPERADSPAASARFLEEARITGQLEHPAIVPVYELAKGGDDHRPFYTMRFIKGRTLSDAIRQYHDRQSRRVGGLALRELLGNFVAVCNAIAYAHSRGILHRDIKPHNVIVGDFGEVVVVDWGLAKLISQKEPETDFLPVSVEIGGSRDQTVQGQVLGTPGYMPPEQAEGRLDLLEERSDVYALGAVLYEILTGQPPFGGEDTLDVLKHVVQDAPTPPRQRAPSTPAALQGVCLKALAKKLDGRYASARELAQEIQRWLADEPVTAYRESIFARSGRWRRRHPALTAMTGAVLAVLVAGGFWVRHESDKRATLNARREAGVLADLEEAASHRDQGQWAEATAAVARAEGRLGTDGPNMLTQRVQQVRADLDMVAALENIRLRKAQVKGQGPNSSVADAAYEAVFDRYGVSITDNDPTEAALRMALSAIRESLVAALYDWAASLPKTASPRRDRVIAIASAADADAWRRQLAGLLARPDRKALESLAHRAEATRQAPATVVLLARVLWQANATATTIELLQRAQELHPGDFWTNHNLALYLLDAQPGEPDEAISYLRAALAVRPQSSLAHGNLGYALGQARRYAQSEAEYRNVVALQPDNVLAYSNLSLALINQGRLMDAEATLRKAIEVDATYLPVRFNLAGLLRKQARYSESLAAYRRAHELASSRSNNPFPTARWVHEAERFATISEKLPAILSGQAQPANAEERAVLAEVCEYDARRLYAESARFYLEAFRGKPSLGEDPHSAARYGAACVAALAGTGQGDGARLDENERARWRKQAVAWLSADLAWWASQSEKKSRDRFLAIQTLKLWQSDKDLSSIRDVDSLNRLPQSERIECVRLWDEVANVLRKYSAPATP